MNDKENNNLQVKFANIAGMLASRFSINPTAGQLYGLLYMSPKPVSLNEMVEKLGISKGSASTNIRILSSWEAVEKVWVDNSRKDYYRADPDTLEIIKKRLVKGMNRRLKEARGSLNSLEKTFQKHQNSGKEDNKDFYAKRLQKTRKMYEQVKNILDILVPEE